MFINNKKILSAFFLEGLMKGWEIEERVYFETHLSTWYIWDYPESLPLPTCERESLLSTTA